VSGKKNANLFLYTHSISVHRVFVGSLSASAKKQASDSLMVLLQDLNLTLNISYSDQALETF